MVEETGKNGGGNEQKMAEKQGEMARKKNRKK